MNGNALRSKQRALVLVVIIAGIVGIAGYALPEKQTDSGRLYLRNSAGPVVFNHIGHSEQTGACVSCHHDLIGEADPASCANCHGEYMQAADFTHEVFTSVEGHECSFCHQIAPDTAAQNCRTCHPESQEADANTAECSTCHDASYTPDLMSHNMLNEVHTSSGCETCHAPREIQTAYHDQCNDCHLRQQPEMFSADDGGARCERCHLK